MPVNRHNRPSASTITECPQDPDAPVLYTEWIVRPYYGGIMKSSPRYGVRPANGVGDWAGATVHRHCGMGSEEGRR